MPSPLELLLDPISLIILALYAILMILEFAAPGRELPNVKNWKLRGLTMFAIYFYLSSYLPLVWDEYLIKHQFVDLSSFGTIGGVVIGTLLFQFGVYVWHRLLHKSNFLWRTFHQMHHSAERVDTYGAFFFSPLDIFGFTLLGSLCLVLIVGLSPGATTATLLLNTFLPLFQHTNIKTPRWLGYIIQRPESHTVHHAKNIHAHNYSDLPLFDIMFGTFKNPKTYEYETGFYEGASSKIGAMLMWEDITKQ